MFIYYKFCMALIVYQLKILIYNQIYLIDVVFFFIKFFIINVIILLIIILCFFYLNFIFRSNLFIMKDWFLLWLFKKEFFYKDEPFKLVPINIRYSRDILNINYIVQSLTFFNSYDINSENNKIFYSKHNFEIKKEGFNWLYIYNQLKIDHYLNKNISRRNAFFYPFFPNDKFDDYFEFLEDFNIYYNDPFYEELFEYVDADTSEFIFTKTLINESSTISYDLNLKFFNSTNLIDYNNNIFSYFDFLNRPKKYNKFLIPSYIKKGSFLELKKNFSVKNLNNNFLILYNNFFVPSLNLKIFNLLYLSRMFYYSLNNIKQNFKNFSVVNFSHLVYKEINNLCFNIKWEDFYLFNCWLFFFLDDESFFHKKKDEEEEDKEKKKKIKSYIKINIIQDFLIIHEKQKKTILIENENTENLKQQIENEKKYPLKILEYKKVDIFFI
jgi:hypothetical protein